jgi:pimeloyl-ACP methyl ester carboxylesterase
MPNAMVNGVRLFYELSGDSAGVPLVLVHGSWATHDNWGAVISQFARNFRVLVYDRRGHGQSEIVSTQGSVREDAADLAALIEHLKLAPAWLVGNSFGGTICLRLACDRPDLLRGVIVHEPPIFSVLYGDAEVAPILAQNTASITTVLKLIASGKHADAAREFVEKVALGPGAWDMLGPESQQMMVGQAHTFLDEARDPEQLLMDLPRLRSLTCPIQLSTGGQSPAALRAIVSKLAAELGGANLMEIAQAGHLPHVTHPEQYVDATAAFIRKNGEPRV